MVAAFPEADRSRLDEDAERSMERVMEVITVLRNMRAEMNVPTSRTIPATILGAEAADAEALAPVEGYIRALARVDVLRFESPDAARAHRQALSAGVDGVQVLVPLAGLVDVDVEVRRLGVEIEALEKDLQRVNAKLANEQYLAKAPAAVVEKDRQRQAELQERHRGLEQRLELLKG